MCFNFVYTDKSCHFLRLKRLRPSMSISIYFLFVFFSLESAVMSNGESLKASGEPMETSTAIPKTTNILDLIDHCLHEVFSHLGPLELFEIKDTCTRFAPIATYHFERKYATGNFSLDSNVGWFSEGKTFYVMKKFWRQFGKCIRSLNVIECNGASNWGLISEYCTQLKSLTVGGCNLQLFDLMDVTVERQILDYLHIDNCSENHAEIIRHFGAFTKSLHLYSETYSSFDYKFIHQSYPELDEIKFKGVAKFKFDNVNVNQFMKVHPKLKKIYWPIHMFDHIDQYTIENYCRNIESISMRFSTETTNWDGKLAALVAFGKLQKLEIDVWSTSSLAPVIEILGQINSLETLSLINSKLDYNSYENLCKLTNLKTLKLVMLKHSTGNPLINVTKQLQLIHLHIIRCNDLLYEDIAVVIEHSNSLESVTFVAPRKDYVLDEKRFLLLTHARQASGINVPLQFFQKLATFDAQLPESEFVELREFDSTDEYLIY